jgi:hypothetical protein
MTTLTLTGRLKSAKTSDQDDSNDTTNAATSSSSLSPFSKTEFSRSISTDRIFKTSSGNYRQTNQRDYEMEITASTAECQLLAQRFDLKNIAQLNATLSLQLDSSTNTERFANGQSAIQVEGTIHAKVTQICVRTNEDFQVDLDLPLFAIVRPAVPASQQQSQAQAQAQAQAARSKNEAEEHINNNNNKSSGFTNKTDKKGKNKKQNGPAKTNYKDDMQELQRLLAQQESFEAAAAANNKGGGKNNNNNKKNKNSQLDDFFSSILEEDGSIVEDEAIYSAMTGQLDVGELVAQTFWLQLDPYPKKPGTRPIQISISG